MSDPKPSDRKRSCSHCGSEVKGRTSLCPECGALLTDPLPPDVRLLTGSREWDSALGVVAALATLISVVGSGTAIDAALRRQGWEALTLLVMLALLVAAPLLSYLGLRTRYPVIGHGYGKTIVILLITVLVLLLGAIVTCFVAAGIMAIHR